MKRFPYRPTVVLVAALAFALTGCITQSTGGSGTAYSYTWWALVLPPLGGLALIGFSIWRFRARRWVAIGGILAGLILLGFVFPIMVNNHALVNDDHFERSGGLWERATQRIDFDDLDSITLEVTLKKNRTNTSKSYTLLCKKKDGSEERLPMDDVLKAAQSEIMVKAKKKGVRLIGFEGE